MVDNKSQTLITDKVKYRSALQLRCTSVYGTDRHPCSEYAEKNRTEFHYTQR